MNTVEDRVFSEFCKKIGVKNIRQYEERELKSQQERAKKKLEFENQINRITTQLEYEKKREEQLQQNVIKFERSVQEVENTMRKREKQIETTKEKMNTVEDRVFSEFCKKIGVKNIRQYEERELKSQQERAKKKLEFENQI